jgi:septum formation topological specificity factor MinE
MNLSILKTRVGDLKLLNTFVSDILSLVLKYLSIEKEHKKIKKKY